MMLYRTMTIMLGLFAAMPAVAQVRSTTFTSTLPDDDEDTGATPTTRQLPAVSPAHGLDRSGRISDSVVGRPGQRQTRGLAPSGIQPTARLSNRIANRVQNRVDRNYDPGALTDPVAVAEDQVRSAVRSRR